MINIKRVYASHEEQDGQRILVDRLWPRGLTKEKAKVDLWLKDIAPSTELRKWFGRDTLKWNEFKKRCRKELNKNADVVFKLNQQFRKGTVTLVFGAIDEQHNDAVVLKEYLKKG